MKQIKSLGVVSLIFVTVLILVIARNANQNLFKQDAQKAVEAAKENNNLILLAELKSSSTKYLIVDLNDTDKYNSSQFQNSINIPFESLLDKGNRKKLKELNGKIVLFSDDISTASKGWVILNQLDFTDIFILHSEENNEVLKYKFQPGTTAKQE